MKCSLFPFFLDGYSLGAGGGISGRVRALNLTVPLGLGQTISGTGRVRASVLSPCRPLVHTSQQSLIVFSINPLSFRRCPDSLDVNSLPAGSHTDASAFLPLNSPSPLEADALQIEEVQPPASGTRKAKVLYNYDAADSSELSLRADEVSGCLMKIKGLIWV